MPDIRDEIIALEQRIEDFRITFNQSINTIDHIKDIFENTINNINNKLEQLQTNNFIIEQKINTIQKSCSNRQDNLIPTVSSLLIEKVIWIIIICIFVSGLYLAIVGGNF